MKNRILCFILTLVLMLGCFSTVASANTVKIVDWVNVTNIETPYAGATPDYTYSVGSDYVDIFLYSDQNPTETWKNGICWYDLTADKYLKPTDTFIEGHKYEILIELMLSDGYEFFIDYQNGNDGSEGNDTRVYYHYKSVPNRSTGQFNSKKYLVFTYNYGVCKKKATDITVDFNYPEYNAQVSSVGPLFSSNVKVLKAKWTEDGAAINDTARFKAGKTYILTVDFTAADGYALPHARDNFSNIDKDAISFKSGARELDWSQSYDYDGQLVMTAAFMVQNIVDANVTHVAFPDIDAPVAGDTPDLNFDDPYGTRVVGVNWYEDGGRALTATDKFESGKRYKVELALDAYSTDFNMNITHATVAGNAATVRWDNSREVYVVTYTFAACAGSVDSVALTVTAPKIGSYPSYLVPGVSGDGYEVFARSFNIYYESNGVWWYDVVNNKNMLIGGQNSKFVEGGVYRVRVTLAPKEGFSFTKGVSATVNGKDAFVEALDNELINVYYYFQPLVADNPCKNGHTFGSYTFNNDATCCKDGTESAKCTKCSAPDTRVKAGSAKGHTDTTKVFKDVVAGKWYVNAINYNYTHKFISGVAADQFGVSVPVTRGMFITILARIAGVDTANNKVSTRFTDVEAGKYYTAAIKWASENKIVNGMSATTFEPNTAIQRQQLCVMIVNFARFMKIELKSAESAIAFKDAGSIAKYAKDAVKTAQMADIVNGYASANGFDFRPTNTATRAEAAQILYKFHKDFMNK